MKCEKRTDQHDYKRGTKKTSVFVSAICVCKCRHYAELWKFFYRGLTEVFIASPFCDQGHEGQVKRNHLSWICREPRWMSSLNREISSPLPLVARKLRIQDNIRNQYNSRNWVGNCVNDHVGKKGTHASRTKEHLRFVSVAFGFRLDIEKQGTWESFFIFLSLSWIS